MNKEFDEQDFNSLMYFSANKRPESWCYFATKREAIARLYPEFSKALADLRLAETNFRSAVSGMTFPPKGQEQ